MSKQEIINIIAGGNSVKDMDTKEICKRAHTIGVNESALYAPVHIGISMDRLWIEKRYDQIKDKPWLLRKIKKEFIWKEAAIFKCDHTTDQFSEMPGVLNGRSSGHCALNLAYQYKPSKIYLFGFDFTGKPYWFGSLEWHKNKDRTYLSNDWIPAFDAAKSFFDKAGIEVTIVGLESKLTQFKKISYEEYLNGYRWCKDLDVWKRI
jgi:hypothetical protein